MVKNLKINKEFFERKVVTPLLIVAGLITGGMMVKDVKNKKEIATTPFAQTVTDYKDSTYFDEYYKNDSNYTISELSEGTKDVDVYDAIYKLEGLLNLRNRMDDEVKRKICGYTYGYTAEEFSNINVHNLTTRYEELLVELKESKTVIEEDKVKVKLSNIYHLCDGWIEKNGNDIAIATLMRAVKSSVNAAMGTTQAECEVKLPPRPLQGEKTYYGIMYHLNETDRSYEIDYVLSGGIYKKALVAIWDLQEDNGRTSLEEALNIAKKCVMSTVTVEDSRFEPLLEYNKELKLVDNGITASKTNTLKK